MRLLEVDLLEVEMKKNTRRQLDELAEKRGLPTSELVNIAVERLIEAEKTDDKPKHSVMEFYGVGRDALRGVDVQKYLNEMRDEWDS